MTPTQLKALLKTLKASGVTNFEHGDLKISLGNIHAPVKEITPIDAPATAEDPIKHKVEEMVSLLKLSDSELVDRLFPDTEAPEEQEESA